MAVQTIGFANKSYINQNPDVADTNKVNDTDMNEIKTVVNNNALELSTTMDNLVYSTTETDTGKTWIDNKPIYRKVFVGTGSTSIDISSLNIDTPFIDMAHSYIHWGRYTPVQLTTTSASNVGSYMAGIYISSNKKTLVIEAGSNISITDYVITLEYTRAS